MTQLRLPAAAAALLLPLLFGCTASKLAVKAVGPSKKVADYFPLRVGDRRIYRIRFANGKTIKREIRIVRKKGNTFHDSKGQSYAYDPYGLRSERRYLLKLPLTAGTRWLSITSLTSVERYVITADSATVTVPAGTFRECIQVRSRDRRGRHGTLEALFYYAPKVGLVKVVTSLDRRYQKVPQWRLELVKYVPATATTKR